MNSDRRRDNAGAGFERPRCKMSPVSDVASKLHAGQLGPPATVTQCLAYTENSILPETGRICAEATAFENLTCPI